MGRTAIPHIVLSVAALIAGTVLACLGHPNEAYVAFGLVGLGGVAAAAVTVPAGTPGTPAGVDLSQVLGMAQRALAGDPSVTATIPTTPPVDVPPPPAAPVAPPVPPPATP